MTISVSISPLTVMAGLDPAIHEAARKVEISGRRYQTPQFFIHAK
jgi:hypothetical protein